MIVERTQRLLERIYSVAGGHSAADFLVTDKVAAQTLEGEAGNPRDVPEKLLVAQDEEGARLALYLDESVLNRLGENNPHSELNDSNLDDFWTVLEGISHFLYLTWRAAAGHAVSLLELELQAEVDKYVCTAVLAAGQSSGKVPRALHHSLFERPVLDPRLAQPEHERYRLANRYAGKYCLRLARVFFGRRRVRGLLPEIRSFYRLGQRDKLRHIDHGALQPG
ncbi:MAG: hypothetical protein HKN59_06090 [Gammaproteobacteria bacterium]|nr:hypothetical protein [Gammaproteobacteria bacterium]